MYRSWRHLFAVLALVTAMGALSFGCSKPEDNPQPSPPADNKTKADTGVAAPPKTHD